MRSQDELELRFEELQQLLHRQVRELTTFSDRPHTVVVLPSLSLDQVQLEKIKGIGYYEERMLYLLLLLRQPNARVILVTSQLVDRNTIDYVIGLLPNEELRSARERLVVLSTNDWSPRSLSEKVLERPWLLARIRDEIDDPAFAHLVTFNMTQHEMELVAELGIPAVGCDPRLEHLGTKSGNRGVFRDAGVPFPEGVEDLHTAEEICQALEKVWTAHPDLKRILVKLNEGFSGEGNAVLDLRPIADLAPGKGDAGARREALARALEQMTFQAPGETWASFSRAFGEMGGIVEAFVEGDLKRSPSVQLKIDITGALSVLSTHDQLLGGKTGQVFLGCTFPADREYRAKIVRESLKVGEVLRERGVHGRFAVDWVTVGRGGGWDLHAIEINIRRGGTTHPFSSMDYLVQGEYQAETGNYLAPDGSERCYVASDNVTEEWLGGLLPIDLHNIIDEQELGFDHGTLTGSVFHMLGAASQFRKIGYTSIGRDPEHAMKIFRETNARLRAGAAEPHIRRNRMRPPLMVSSPPPI